MQDSTKIARQKAKILMAVMSITTTLSGWGVISVIQPVGLPAVQVQTLSVGSGRALFSVAQKAQPLAIAITRSSN